MYPNYRDDPIFPARDLVRSDNKTTGLDYYNNSPVSAVLACVDDGEICDAQLIKCEKAPGRRVVKPFDGHRDGATLTQDDLARALLLSSLTGSGCIASSSASRTLDAQSHCNYLECYSGLPPDQWIIEARHWFEASLALIQLNILTIVRGTENTGPDFDGIPPAYRGICNLGKFRTVGWRNVSVVGFFGLLLLALAVTLASIRTQEGDLWITVGLKALSQLISGTGQACKACLYPESAAGV